jgi:ABC-type Na+ efflux pump permease subunit
MRAFLSMVRANLKMTLRDRTRLFWLLLFPAVLIVVFGSLVGGNSDSKVVVGVANGEATPVAKQMTAAMEGSKFLELQSGTEKAELAKLHDGNVDAVVVFPQEELAHEEKRMNQRKTNVLPSQLNPYDVISDSPLGDFASNRPGPRFSVHAFACAVCGTEAADPTAFGQGRCR